MRGRSSRIWLASGMVFILALLAAFGGSSSKAASQAGGGLVIASYGSGYTAATKQYFADPFAQANGGVKVTFVDSLVGGAAAAIRAQAKAGKVQWDLLDGFSGIDAWQLYRDGLLAKLSKAQQKRLGKSLSPGMVTPFGYSYGNTTNVITCNTKSVDRCPSNAREFFDTENFPGKRTMYASDPLPPLIMAAVAAGANPKKVFPINLGKAFAMLEKLRPSIRVFYSSGDQGVQIMTSGEADMGVYWDARAWAAHDAQSAIRVSYGDGIYEPYYLAAVKNSPNAANALAYLSWVATHPKGATSWMKKVQYGIPIPAAFRSLPASVASRLGDNPKNLRRTVAVNYPWYLDHRAEIDKRWQAFVAG